MRELIKKVLTKEVILYIVFGVCTTIVNIGSFALMNTVFKWNENLSNFIAIILAVLFAYVTNKDMVFHSKAEKLKEKCTEFAKFMAGRAFTMLVEYVGGIFLFMTPIPKIVSKLGLTIIVIILNFFISKFFAFKQTKEEVK